MRRKWSAEARSRNKRTSGGLVLTGWSCDQQVAFILYNTRRFNNNTIHIFTWDLSFGRFYLFRFYFILMEKSLYAIPNALIEKSREALSQSCKLLWGYIAKYDKSIKSRNACKSRDLQGTNSIGHVYGSPSIGITRVMALQDKRPHSPLYFCLFPIDIHGLFKNFTMSFTGSCLNENILF